MVPKGSSESRTPTPPVHPPRRKRRSGLEWVAQSSILQYTSFPKRLKRVKNKKCLPYFGSLRFTEQVPLRHSIFLPDPQESRDGAVGRRRGPENDLLLVLILRRRKRVVPVAQGPGTRDG